MKNRTAIDNLIIIIGVTAFVILCLTSYTWPYDRDQGIIGWVADEILRGGLPYRDAWDVKGPLPYYVYAIGQYLAGHQEWGIRLINSVIVAYGMVAMWWLCFHFTKNFIVSWTACLILGAWYFISPYLNSQPDGWMGMLLIVMFNSLIMDQGELKRKTAIVCGLCLVFIGLIKPPYAIFVLIPFVYTVLYGWKKRVDAARFVAIIAALGVSSVVAIMLYFYQNGALKDLFDVVFMHNWVSHKNYFDHVSKDFFYLMLVSNFSQKPIILPFLLLVAGLLLMWQDKNPHRYLILCWLICATIVIVVQQKYFLYHFYIVFPLVILMAAYAMHKVAIIAHEAWMKVLCIICLLLSYESTLSEYAPPAYKLKKGEISKEAYFSSFQLVTFDSSNVFGTKVAEYIRLNNEDDKPIYLLGFDPIMHIWADTQSASRYGFLMPFVSARDVLFKRYSQELVQDLRDNKPEFIVVPLNDSSSVQPIPSIFYTKKITGFKPLLNEHYYVDKVTPFHLVYRYHDRDICYFEFEYDVAGGYIVNYWLQYFETKILYEKVRTAMNVVDRFSEQEEGQELLENVSLLEFIERQSISFPLKTGIFSFF